MTASSFRPAKTRRSGIRHRSASTAPAYLHLIPIALFILLIFIGLQSARALALPLNDRLANSWQPPNHNQQDSNNLSTDWQLTAFTPEVQRWRPKIEEWSVQSNLPPELIATVIQIESCGDPIAQSPAGAQGLFQVMPYHFEKGQDPLQIQSNARAGLSYLQRSYRLAEADPSLTLAGYNGGHGVIQWPRSEWPLETQRYSAWGAGILTDIQAEKLPSPTLNDWLEAGGASLCHQAAQRSPAAR